MVLQPGGHFSLSYSIFHLEAGAVKDESFQNRDLVENHMKDYPFWKSGD
jgi:hypothetical protein